MDYNFRVLILITLLITVLLKLNIFIFLMLIILIILFFNYDLYIFDSSFKNENIISMCTNPLEGHLGDHIFNTYFFYKIKNYIENNNIIIHYYIKKDYHNEIKEFINSKNIIIKDFKNKGLHFHVGGFNKINGYYKYFFEYNILKSEKFPFDKMYIEYFNEISNKLNIPIKFDSFVNQDKTFLLDYETLDEKYKNIDILIINSLPQSNQYKLNINEWTNFIYKLSSLFKIVTTLKVQDIPCTLDDKLSLKKIGAISTHSKIIIAINTGPTSSIFNYHTLNYTKKIYIFDNLVKFVTIPFLENIDDLNKINIDELIKIINNF